MDSKLKRIYVPMTETGFYILFCLQKPQHGYGIGLQVKKMTDGEVSISAGTMYGTLSKMEKDGLSPFLLKKRNENYTRSPLGREMNWIWKFSALNDCIETAWRKYSMSETKVKSDFTQLPTLMKKKSG